MARASATTPLLTAGTLMAALVGSALAAVPAGSPVGLTGWPRTIELPLVPPPPRVVAPTPPVPVTSASDADLLMPASRRGTLAPCPDAQPRTHVKLTHVPQPRHGHSPGVSGGDSGGMRTAS